MSKSGVVTAKERGLKYSIVASENGGKVAMKLRDSSVNSQKMENKEVDSP